MNNQEAAKFNTKILNKYRYDFEAALKREKGTMLQPGSEFRDANNIEQLFQAHKLWPKMKDIVKNGVTYRLNELSEE